MDLVLLVAAAIQLATGLECGIDVTGTEEQYREITNWCLSGNNTAVIYSDSVTTETYDSNPTTERYKLAREADDSESDEEVHQQAEEPSSTTHKPKAVGQNCVVQCVFQRLGMTDSSGYPKHDKILEGLLRSSQGRELRDFLQDSTDECFRFMQQADTLDSCTYSSLLVTCLAEKGRQNCGDWPVGKLPFQ
ncbi:putative odorant binding-like protein [Rhyzopertha dominica]|nr:putative odorant binding-like protein [Rhyzopertha dominica]